jgi:sporulation protein YlmC with PRC-barrel domain
MKYRPLTAMALTVAASLSTSAAFAQSSSSDSSLGDGYSTPKLHATDGMKDIKEIRASKLIGVNVTSKDGENLGQVQDLVMDPLTGKIRFALVGKGFMAGLGEKLLPVPWKAVNVQSERQFALNVDKSKWASAPALSETDNMDQPDYVIRIYRFYDLEPQTDVGGFSGQQSGQGQGSSADNSENSLKNESDHRSSTQPDRE